MDKIQMNIETDLSSVRKPNAPSWLLNIIYDNWIIVFIVLFYISFAYIVNHLSGNKFIIDFRLGHHWFDAYTLYFMFIYFVIFVMYEFIYKKNYSIKNVIFEKFYINYMSVENLIGFGIVYFLLNPFFSVFSSIKSNIPKFNYYYSDEALMNIDHFIHFGNHPWELLQPFLGLPVITQLLDLFYSLWFYLLFAVCVWMAITRHRRLRIQFFVSFFITWIVLGNVLALLFASGGPCYFNLFVDGQNPYSELFKYLNKCSYQATPLMALQNQNILWVNFKSGVPLEFGGGISAMPSLHVAISVLFALIGKSVHKIIGIVFCYYAIFIFLGSVHLGWHYAIDGYIAIFSVLLIWKFSDKMLELIGYPRIS